MESEGGIGLTKLIVVNYSSVCRCRSGARGSLASQTQPPSGEKGLIQAVL